MYDLRIEMQNSRLGKKSQKLLRSKLRKTGIRYVRVRFIRNTILKRTKILFYSGRRADTQERGQCVESHRLASKCSNIAITTRNLRLETQNN